MDRDAIRAREQAATPGPWEPLFTVHGDPFVVPACTPYPSRQIAAVSVAPEDYGRADAEFIAHARKDIPTLLDALEAAEAERDAFKDEFYKWEMTDEDCPHVDRMKAAEALVSTLGEALERYADETAWTDGVCEFRATPNRDPWGSVVDWTGVHDNGALARAALESFRAFTERAPAPVIREREAR